MTPAAVCAHHVAGRTRIRVAAKRGDSEYFVRVREQLTHCPGVASVTTNEATGSVLVLHDAADPGVLIAYARTFELFEMSGLAAAQEAASRPPAQILSDGISRLESWVRTGTNHATDLRSVALSGLVGATIWQMLRGPLLPAAATLLWYTLAVTAKDDRSGAGSADARARGYEEVGSPSD
jgi:hypothetical protein